MTPRPLLVVEDNPDDVFFLKRVLKAKGVSLPIVVTVDGRHAISYLSGKAEFADRNVHPLPLLVLLDLQLPYFTGLQVLEWIREQPLLRRIPVIIFSSSSQPSDINTAYDLGANSYLVKPTDVAELGRIVDGVRSYWLTTNCGPIFSPNVAVAGVNPGESDSAQL